MFQQPVCCSFPWDGFALGSFLRETGRLMNSLSAWKVHPLSAVHPPKGYSYL